MTIRKENILTLKDLGLTINQSKVYLSLVGIGTSSAKQTSTNSKVPREKVYAILLELQKKGLVYRIISRPFKFKAVPIDKGISVLVKKKKQQYKKLLEKSKDLAKKFQGNTSFSPMTDSDFVLIPTKEINAITRRDVIKDLKDSLDCITTLRRFSELLTVAGEVMLYALEKRVDFRFIIDTSEHVEIQETLLNKLSQYSSFKIKYLPHSHKACFAVADKKGVYFVTYPECHLLDSPMLWSNNSYLARVFEDYFEIIWNTALETPTSNIDEGQI